MSSSVAWGSADFLGGTQSRTHGAVRTAFWSQAVMLVVMWTIVAALLLAGTLGELRPRVVLLGALGGAIGVSGLVAFYRALAIGPMAIVPPITGAGVVIPVAIGLATGEPPSVRVLSGIGLAIAGIVLASSGELGASSGVANKVTPRVLALCAVAAVCFAAIFVLLDEASGTSISDAFIATAGVRVGGLVALVTIALATRLDVRRGMSPGSVARIARIGVLDTGANVSFAVASTMLDLEIAAVLASLYPAVTSLLAVVVLGERLARIQLVGIAFALGGVALLAGA